jgi:hypothetical protein
MQPETIATLIKMSVSAEIMLEVVIAELEKQEPMSNLTWSVTCAAKRRGLTYTVKGSMATKRIAALFNDRVTSQPWKDRITFPC